MSSITVPLMSDERPKSPPAAFCSESVATIDTVKRPYCPRNPCAFFAALQGKRCAMVNRTGCGNRVWHGNRSRECSRAFTSGNICNPRRRAASQSTRQDQPGVAVHAASEPKDRPKKLVVAQAAHPRRLAKGSQRVRMSAHRAFLRPPPRPAGIAWISSVSIFG